MNAIARATVLITSPRLSSAAAKSPALPPTPTTTNCTVAATASTPADMRIARRPALVPSGPATAATPWVPLMSPDDEVDQLRRNDDRLHDLAPVDVRAHLVRRERALFHLLLADIGRNVD